MIDDIKNELNAMAEADYRDFSKKLIPEASLPLLACLKGCGGGNRQEGQGR